MKVTAKFLVLGFIAAALSACNTSPESENGTFTVDETASSEVTSYQVGTGSTSTVDIESEDLDSVFYFEFDKSTLTAETRRDLNAYAAALLASPRNIRLEGHADERGTREYNIALGERRAKSVADYLIGAGVSAGRIETISYGEERPAVNGSNNGAWQQNRRVELK